MIERFSMHDIFDVTLTNEMIRNGEGDEVGTPAADAVIYTYSASPACTIYTVQLTVAHAARGDQSYFDVLLDSPFLVIFDVLLVFLPALVSIHSQSNIFRFLLLGGFLPTHTATR
jgi:hypothetical protein